MPTLVVTPSRGAPYPVVVEVGGLSRLPRMLPPGAGPVAVVADSRVAELYGITVGAALRGAGRPVSVHTFPEGERSKTRQTKARLEDELAARGVSRDSVVVGLGGGVTTDLAGFVAATWMRGIPHLPTPTSLLAMVDAAIGGKTGVDAPAGKNLVGAFHQPCAVVIDPSVLSTLPAEAFDCGLAEMLKHALIADPEHLEQLVAEAPRLGPGATDRWVPLIARSVEIKAAVVGRDAEESGERAVLNVGHTVGHAIELASGYRVSHGHAVAVGIAAEARMAERLGLLPEPDVARIEAALDALGLPSMLPGSVDASSVLAATAMDKKGRSGRVRYALLAAVGRPARGDGGWTQEVPDGVVLSVLEDLGG